MTREYYFERVAHRGGAGLAPENTLAAFRNALTLSVNAVELDVHLSRDRQLIVFHDNEVARRTNGAGNILDLDFAYLRSLNAAAHFPGGWPQPQQIPTLREVLELVKGHVDVYIEIKQSKKKGVYGSYPGIAEAVVQEVRAVGMLGHVLVISFDWSVLPHVKQLEPRIRTGALVSEDVWNDRAAGALERLMEQVRALGCEWINLDRKLFTDLLLRSAHEHGFKLGLWTVNTLDAIRHYAGAGVDSITTDWPNLFAELR
ncbi:MAG TPA: glycerophosphodiester phosphodiesterase [Ktedonobacteraceae bacterium]|nr:glycerophosphodiester phosphodiesterase [Ktedonobacteraceae bacterium]